MFSNHLYEPSFSAPAKDESGANWSRDGKNVSFEHFIRAPVEIALKSKTPRLFKGLQLATTNQQISQVVKVDFAVRDGAGYRPLDTLQMRGGESFLITKRGAKIECGGSVRFVPPKVCTRIVALRIRIVKSEGAGCLGFAKLRIFSESSLKNAPVDETKQPTSAAFYGDYQTTIPPSVPNRTELHQSEPATSNEANDVLPQWCLDSVTTEVMTRPVQLPSGHWVDHSTVVKWRAESRIWYRSLTDPFTGQPIDYELEVDPVRRENISKYLNKNSTKQ